MLRGSMKKHLQNQRPELFLMNFIVLTLLFIFPLKAQNQTFVIQGNISASNTPISRAYVTLVDKSDTTNQVSAITDVSGNFSLNVITSVELSKSLPSEFALAQNYPNPFSSSTSISYELNKQTDVQLTIYDVLGREVRKFSVGNQNVGVHGVQWDARNDFGVKLASGFYFYRMQVGNKTLTKKMVLGNSLNNINISLQSFSVHTNYSQRIQNEFLENRIYQMKIDNYYTRTSPLIVPKVIDNIILTKDTTINISVDKQIIYATTNVNIESVLQIVRGFGAACPWYLSAMTDSEVETAFGTGDGQIGLTILRLSIDPDSTLWYKYVTSAKKAHDMGAIIFASPWNAPPSLTEVVNGQTRVRHDKYVEYANHLKSFNSYFTANGAPMYAISVQNEPDYASSWTGWTANEMLTFMKVNAPTIGTKVMAPESFQFRRNMSDPILNDSVACSNLDIVGGHIYGAGLDAYPLAKQKGKDVWMTEHLIGENNSGFNWSWAIQLANEMSDVMKAEMNAYVWWTMVRYYGPIGDGTKATNPQDPRESYPKKGEVTKKGYVMSQFSKFIRPGYHIVQSTSSRGSVKITAATGDLSKVVIVVINSDTEPIVQTFNLQNSSANAFTPYTTTSTQNFEKGAIISVQNGSFTVTLEPSSVITFVSN
jgi:glucuronoarabinoxylan endo-1,4-beta-xylanase